MIGAVFGLLLFQVAVPRGGTVDPVRGVVRAEATGAALAGARVEVLDRSAPDAIADSVGGYTLQDMVPGRHHLRISAPGYESLTIEVLLADDGPLRLDAILTRSPERLATVRVVAWPAGAPGSWARVIPTRDADESGVWRLSGEAMRRSPALDDADPLRLLATAPEAQMVPEAAAAVHLRGGSSDQNRFLLDGAPVYSPVHPGLTASALDPGIVDELVVHGAVPSARFGGGLSSIIEVRTPSDLPATATAAGGFEPTALRTSVALPLAGGRAGVWLSARRSYTSLQDRDGGPSTMPGSWSDSFGKLSVRVGGGALTVSTFQAANGLGFPVAGDPESGRITSPDTTHNEFAWSSSTRAIVWRRPLRGRAALETRLWHARFDGSAGWHPGDTTLAMRARVRDDGVAVVATRADGTGGQRAAGMQLQRLATRYAVASAVGEGSLTSPVQPLAAAPLVGSAFVQESWRPGRTWTLGAGLRASLATHDVLRLEPRLSAAFEPAARVRIALGIGRMHQYAQSLRNEESVLGTLVAPDLLVAAGTPTVGASRVPVASSDELTASADVALDAHTRLRWNGYARRLHDLLLVAPAASGPFATDGITVGDGQSWGTGLAVDRQVGRLALQGSYAIGATTRRTPGAVYHPGFAPRQSLTLAAGWRLAARTHLRSAVWATSGRPTTAIGDDFGWDTRDAFSGAREVSGTPAHTIGPLGGARLPTYLSVDVGIRHAIPVGRGLLTGFASLDNALGRKNVAGYVLTPTASSRRDLVMLPPSLLLGLSWRY